MSGGVLGTGVYAIRCVVNDKRYVGSAARSFPYRWLKHQTQLRAGTHHSKPLQGAWNKHGEAAFVFEILAECDPSECISREQLFIDEYRSTNRNHGYNVCPLAGSSRGYRHSEESRKNMSEAQTGRVHSLESREKRAATQRGRKRPPFGDEWKAKLGNAVRGIKRSAETRAKMSSVAVGRVRTPEHCAAISAGKMGRKIKPLTADHRLAISKSKIGKPRQQQVIEAMNRGRQEAKKRREAAKTINGATNV